MTNEKEVGGMSEIKNDISTKVRLKVAAIMQLAIGVTPITKAGEVCKEPTVFVEYSAHVNNFHVSIFSKGWRSMCPPDYDIWVNIADEDQDKVLEELNECYELILDVSGRNKCRDITDKKEVGDMSGKILPIAEGEVLQKCVDTYGKSLQVDIAIEEMSELTKALIKERRVFYQINKATENQFAIKLAKEMRATTNIAEEMADVIIMLTQLSLIFENHDEVQEFIDFKLKREEERLKNLKTEVSEYDS